MPELLGFMLAPGLSFGASLALVVLSFFTSATTAALGLGGGAMLVAAMSLVMPAAIVVPVHGAVQLGSNGGRAILRRSHIQWQFAGWFVLGSAVGALIGGRIAIMLPDAVFKALIALFILYSAWAPKPRVSSRGRSTTVLAGGFTAIIGMLTGISGPLVISFLRNLGDRREIVGTHAFLMTCQNTLKIITFILFGFAFAAYLPLILAMVATGFLGSIAGGHVLDRLPERAYRMAFKAILTVIALQLLWRLVFP